MNQDILDFMWNATNSPSWEFYDNFQNISDYYFSGNISDGEDDEKDVHSSILPWWASIIWTLLFGALIVVAVGGNLLVMWIVLGRSIK